MTIQWFALDPCGHNLGFAVVNGSKDNVRPYSMCFLDCFRLPKEKRSWVDDEPIDDDWKKHMWETGV